MKPIEFKNRKEKLKEAIKNLIRDFETETSVNILKIKVDAKPYNLAGKTIKPRPDVKIKTDIDY